MCQEYNINDSKKKVGNCVENKGRKDDKSYDVSFIVHSWKRV
jgi:hypothetical protein